MEREKEERRQTILDAAERRFLQHGFENARIDDIGADAQFTKRTLYQYFSTKEDMIMAVIVRKAEEMTRVYEEAAAGEGSGLGKVSAVISVYFEYFLKHPVWYGLLSYRPSEAVIIAAGPQYKALRDLKYGSKAFFERLLDEGIEDGSVAGSVDVRMGAQFLMVASLGMLDTLMRIPDDYWRYADMDRDAFVGFSVARLTESLAARG